MRRTIGSSSRRFLSRLVLGLAAAVGLGWGLPSTALAQHGGHMGGMGGMGGHMGGMGGMGGHMGGHMGGMGWGGGHHMGGGGYMHHGGYGGYGGLGYGGFFPGYMGLGGLGLGYGLGFGYPGYGLGYGLGYGYGYGYPSYGYGLGYGGYYPGYGRNYGYSYGYYPGSYYTYGGSGYGSLPGSSFTYSRAYGTSPLVTTSATAPSSWPLPKLGIDEKGVTNSAGQSAIEVTKVQLGSPAELAGVKTGDQILSANGFLTQKPGNLAWIINHHAPKGVLTMQIKKADGKTATATATLH